MSGDRREQFLMKKLLSEWKNSGEKYEGPIEWYLKRKTGDKGKLVFSLTLLGIFIFFLTHIFIAIFILVSVVIIITCCVIILEVWKSPDLHLIVSKIFPFIRLEFKRIFLNRVNYSVILLTLIIGFGSGYAYLVYQPQSQEAFVANQASAVRTVLDRQIQIGHLTPELQKTLSDKKLDANFENYLKKHEELTNRLYSFQIMENFNDYTSVQTEQLLNEEKLLKKFKKERQDGQLNFIRKPYEINAQLAINRELTKEKMVIETRQTTALGRFSEWFPIIILVGLFLTFVIAAPIVQIDNDHSSIYSSLPIRTYLRIICRVLIYQLIFLTYIVSSIIGYFSVFKLFSQIGSLQTVFAYYWIDSFKASHVGLFIVIHVSLALIINLLMLFLHAMLSLKVRSYFISTTFILSTYCLIGLLLAIGNRSLEKLEFLYPYFVVGGISDYGIIFSGALLMGLLVACSVFLRKQCLKYDHLQGSVW